MGLDKPKMIHYNESKFYRMKSEEQRQVAVTTVAQRARHWWEPAHAMAVNGFVRSAEKGFSRYLPPRPRVTAEGYSCVNAAYLYLNYGVVSQCTCFEGNVFVPKLGWHHESIVPIG